MIKNPVIKIAENVILRWDRPPSGLSLTYILEMRPQCGVRRSVAPARGGVLCWQGMEAWLNGSFTQRSAIGRLTLGCP